MEICVDSPVGLRTEIQAEEIVLYNSSHLSPLSNSSQYTINQRYNSPNGIEGFITSNLTDYSIIERNEGGLSAARDFFKISHPIICVFGLLGNTLTLLVLTRKRLRRNCEGTENNMNVGLTALAVSDFLFCAFVLPYGLQLSDQFGYTSMSFKLLYKVYAHLFINTFILTSTWLTVTMATSRYLAICHPFQARAFIGVTGTKVSIFLVFCICALVNVPRVFENQIETLHCQDGRQVHFKLPGYLAKNTKGNLVYTWVYSVVAIFLPLAMLAFCNICLVKVLHASSKLRKRCRVAAAHVESNYRVTSILVTIVVMYIVLVSPAEILRFVQDQLSNDKDSFPALLLAIEITNLLQIANFSCNFILYCVLNVHFRAAFRDLFCGCSRKTKSNEITIRPQKQPLRRTVATYV